MTSNTPKKNAKWPLVSVVIPYYNAMKYLPDFLDSIIVQTYQNFEILVIDDLSKDESLKYLKKHYPEIRLIEHKENKGFCYTVNEGIRKTDGEYVFMVNQDTIHTPDYLLTCIEKMQSDRDIAAITGKVYKYDFDKKEPTRVFDSVGLLMLKNRRFLDEGQGEEDRGQFEEEREIFGISGQNAIYRRQALDEVSIPVDGKDHKEVFDEDFFMYKEEVDLAWRLRLFGWKAWYTPKAVAWHGRGTSAIKRLNNKEILNNRKKMNRFQRFHSIKNRYLMMIKNEMPGMYFMHLPFIWWDDLLYFAYNLVFDTRNIPAYLAALKKIPKMIRKRRWIMKNRPQNIRNSAIKNFIK